MTEQFDQQKALRRYSELEQLIPACSESSEDGSCWYPDMENGFNVSAEITELDEQARDNGLIYWHQGGQWTLRPMTEEEKREWALIRHIRQTSLILSDEEMIAMVNAIETRLATSPDEQEMALLKSVNQKIANLTDEQSSFPEQANGQG